VDPVVLVLAAAAALVAVGFVAWQAAVGAGVVAAYRERAADSSPPLAVFVDRTDPRALRLLVRNRAEQAVLRVVAWERRGLGHDSAPLASFERIEAGAAADLPIAAVPTAPACHVEWTPDVPGAVRRQADVPFLVLEAAGA
jgi:hypothetical protein